MDDVDDMDVLLGWFDFNNKPFNKNIPSLLFQLINILAAFSLYIFIALFKALFGSIFNIGLDHNTFMYSFFVFCDHFEYPFLL